jgi:hypothetical protein
MVVGSYAPNGGGGILLGDVDPATLHQTTHAISAEYVARDAAMTDELSDDSLHGLLIGDEAVWLDALPGYQRAIFEELRTSGVAFDDLGRVWLEAAGATNTAPFGVAAGARIFFDKLLDELHDLLCAPDKYAAERDSVLAGFKGGQATAVAAVTAAVAPPLAAAPPFLAPAVAVALCVIGKAGLMGPQSSGDLDHPVGCASSRRQVTTARACDQPLIATPRGWPCRSLEAAVGWWGVAPWSAVH